MLFPHFLQEPIHGFQVLCEGGNYLCVAFPTSSKLYPAVIDKFQNLEGTP